MKPEAVKSHRRNRQDKAAESCFCCRTVNSVPLPAPPNPSRINTSLSTHKVHLPHFATAFLFWLPLSESTASPPSRSAHGSTWVIPWTGLRRVQLEVSNVAQTGLWLLDLPPSLKKRITYRVDGRALLQSRDTSLKRNLSQSSTTTISTKRSDSVLGWSHASHTLHHPSTTFSSVFLFLNSILLDLSSTLLSL